MRTDIDNPRLELVGEQAILDEAIDNLIECRGDVYSQGEHPLQHYALMLKLAQEIQNEIVEIIGIIADSK